MLPLFFLIINKNSFSRCQATSYLINLWPRTILLFFLCTQPPLVQPGRCWRGCFTLKIEPTQMGEQLWVTFLRHLRTHIQFLAQETIQHYTDHQSGPSPFTIKQIRTGVQSDTRRLSIKLLLCLNMTELYNGSLNNKCLILRGGEKMVRKKCWDIID